jgi:hypothetical protein
VPYVTAEEIRGEKNRRETYNLEKIVEVAKLTCVRVFSFSFNVANLYHALPCPVVVTTR